MRYPIVEEDMINECKEYFTKRGLEFYGEDEAYIRTFAKVVNQVYAAGVQAGTNKK